MLTKVYLTIWTAFFGVVALVAVTGYLSMMALVIFGFITFGLIFLGMMCVLPHAVSHPSHIDLIEVSPSAGSRAAETKMRVTDINSPVRV